MEESKRTCRSPGAGGSAPGDPTRIPYRDQHLVDDMDDAVLRADIGGLDARIPDHHFSVAHLDVKGLAVQGVDRARFTSLLDRTFSPSTW